MSEDYFTGEREDKPFENFHAELSALAGRCDFANAAENNANAAGHP